MDDILHRFLQYKKYIIVNLYAYSKYKIRSIYLLVFKVND